MRWYLLTGGGLKWFLVKCDKKRNVDPKDKLRVAVKKSGVFAFWKIFFNIKIKLFWDRGAFFNDQGQLFLVSQIFWSRFFLFRQFLKIFTPLQKNRDNHSPSQRSKLFPFDSDSLFLFFRTLYIFYSKTPSKIKTKATFYHKRPRQLFKLNPSLLTKNKRKIKTSLTIKQHFHPPFNKLHNPSVTIYIYF